MKLVGFFLAPAFEGVAAVFEGEGDPAAAAVGLPNTVNHFEGGAAFFA